MSSHSLYWGDLHNHNAIGFGRGSLERTYSIARQSLDFLAFTPHGWWPDISDDDPAVAGYHREGFATVHRNWDRIREKANHENGDSRFVAFLAFEWHSLRWGDYCVIFPGNRGDLCCAENLHDLQRFVAAEQAIMIPHHCAYRRGWRGTRWEHLDAALSPVAEVFSEHGNSLEPASSCGMYGHSMGGSDRSQTIQEQLSNGAVLGFTAGTDDHFGHPGSYGEGLTGIYASELCRQGIMEALRKRHSYGVTGDRIELDFRAEGGFMGDILPVAGKREFSIEARAQDEMDYVELLKNGRSVEKWNAPSTGSAEGRRRQIRFEWGWDGMMSTALTEWHISIRIEPGRILRATPCFCSGRETAGRENRMRILDSDMVEIDSFTCRSNNRPTHSAILLFESGADAWISVSMNGEWQRRAFRQTFALKAQNTRNGDFHRSILPAFTAPRMKVHAGLCEESLHFSRCWNDLSVPEELAAYSIKVMQKNGQMAWSSPIWYEKAGGRLRS